MSNTEVTPVSLDELAAGIKAAVAQSGVDATVSEKKRRTPKEKPEVTVPVPVLRGEDILPPVRMAFMMLAGMLDCDTPNAKQLEAFSDALAMVGNKYVPAVKDYVPETALVAASAGIGWTMYTSHQRRQREALHTQLSIPIDPAD